MKKVSIFLIIFVSLFFISDVKATTFTSISLNGYRLYQDSSIYLPGNGNRTLHLETDIADELYNYAFVSYLAYDQLTTYYSSSVFSLVGYETHIPRNFYNSDVVGTIKYFVFEPKWDCGSQGNCIWNGDIVFYGTTSDYQLIGWGFSNEPIQVDTASGELINQNNQIITQNGQLIQNQQATNDKLDNITDMDISEEDKELPDDSSYQDYNEAEGDLIDKINEADMDSLDIAIDTDTSNFIWDTITDLFNSHPMIMSTIIALLSIGIIKLALGR